MHRRSANSTARLLATLWALVAPCLGGCGGEPPPGPRRVILITCDTLRPDRLGAYGYQRPTSPNLDAFAREGIVFDAAYSSAPWTRPALASLLTGRLPEEVGAAPGNQRMPPAEVETLAERIAAHGIQTAAVVSNGLIRRPPPGAGDVDLQQGFQVYDDRMNALERNREMPERRAPRTTDAALMWLEQHEASGGGPFFLWVHYQDPHGPYTPPEHVAGAFDRVLAPDEPRLAPGRTMQGEGQIPFYQLLGEGAPELRPGRYRDRYDAEIAYFDAHLGRLLAWLRQRPWYPDALVIFSSDHGESLGEHDFWFCHGENVQREEVHVPLVVRYPRGAVRPRAQRTGALARVEAPVSHLDLWPTVLEALGLPPGPCRGLSLFARQLPPERVLAQAFPPPRAERAQWAASDGRWRLLWRADGVRRLYDVRADPGETQDVSARHPEVVARLLAGHASATAELPGAVPEGLDLELDPATREALQKLGYVEAGGQ